MSGEQHFSSKDIPLSVSASSSASTADSRLRPSIIERAFELARSGTCHSVAEVASQLKRERFDAVEAHLAGPSIRRELRRLCASSKAGASATGPGSKDAE